MLTLSRTLEGVKDELLVISDHVNAPGYKRNEADMHSVCELAEILRDAIIEFQVRVNLGSPDQLAEFIADTCAVCTTKGNI